jgi:hypothetical protein
MSQDGQVQLLLEDMLLETNIEQLIMLYQKQESLKWFIHQLTDPTKLH